LTSIPKKDKERIPSAHYALGKNKAKIYVQDELDVTFEDAAELDEAKQEKTGILEKGGATAARKGKRGCGDNGVHEVYIHFEGLKQKVFRRKKACQGKKLPGATWPMNGAFFPGSGPLTGIWSSALLLKDFLFTMIISGGSYVRGILV